MSEEHKCQNLHRVMKHEQKLATERAEQQKFALQAFLLKWFVSAMREDHKL